MNKAGANSPPAQKPQTDALADCRSRDPDTAISGCTQHLRASKLTASDRAGAHSNLAYAYDKKGMLEQAMAEADHAIAADPKSARGHLARGFIRMRASDLDRAMADFSRAIEIDPQNGYGYYRRGNVRSRRGDFEGALQDYDKAHGLLPKDPLILGDRGLAHYNKGEFDKAFADFNRSIELGPAIAGAYVYRGTAHEYLGDHERALSDLSRAIEIEPKNAYAYAVRGGVLNERNDFERGLADIERALQLNPRFALAYVNRGTAHMNQGAFERALKEFAQALEIDANFAAAYRGRCQVHLIRDEPELALENCNRAVELGPRLTAAYTTRGSYFANRGENDKALTDYNRALALVPRNASALAARGRAYVELGQFDRGMSDFSRAIEINANLRTAFAYRGLALANKGELERALADLSTAIQLDPRLSEAFAARADIHLKKGQRNLAIADYRKVLSLPARSPRERNAQIRAAETLTSLSQNTATAAPGPSGKALPPAIDNRTVKGGRRIALVVGNSAYPHVGTLRNPVNDAKTIAAALRRIGFAEVIEKQDLGLAQMMAALKEFSDRANSADWAVIYFAGHGVEMAGSAYLIPTDAKLEKDGHVPYETIPLDRLLQTIEGTRHLRLVILDACRNNPFVTRMARTGGAARAIGRGLPAIEVEGDVLVAYATKHGQTALDGDGDNSPYALALAENIRSANVDVRVMFGRVRDAVRKATNNQQEPYTYGSIGGDLHYFVASAQ